MNRKLQGLAIFIVAISSCIVTQAEETNIVVNKEVENDSLYVDIKLDLPYKKLDGLFISPLQIKGELLSPFGDDRGSYMHQGIDIRAEEGTPIFSGGKGTVTKAAPDSKGVNSGGGHMIFIDYGQGLEGRYMHLSKYAVKEGDVVEAGQVIGFTGDSGGSTTPHLHFEYRVDGTPLDPAFIFEAIDVIENTKQDNVEVEDMNINKLDDFFVIQN